MGSIHPLKPQSAEYADIEIIQRIGLELGPRRGLVPEATSHAGAYIHRAQAKTQAPADLREQGEVEGIFRRLLVQSAFLVVGDIDPPRTP